MSRGDKVSVLVLLVMVAASWTPRLRGPIDLRWDGAAYYILGTSLASGEGYRYLNEPGHVEAVNYPPLLPLFVAAHQVALQTSDPYVVGVALRWSYVALTMAYVLVAFAFLRSVFGTSLALAGTLLVAVNMATIWLSDRLYADLPFALLVTGTMLLQAWKPRWNMAAWALASAAFLLRTAGIAVLIAWVADAYFAKRWRALVWRVALASIPIVAWQGYVQSSEQQRSYRDPPYSYAFADYSLYNVSYTRNMMLRDPARPELGRASATELPLRVISNLKTAVLHLGQAVSTLERDFSTLMQLIKEQPVGRLIPWRIIPLTLNLFGFFVIVGAILFARGVHRRLSVMLLAYFLLLLLLPTDYHWPRLLAGVAPLLSACFVLGVTALGKAADRLLPAFPGKGALSVAPTIAVAFAVLLQVVTAGRSYLFDLRTVTHAWPGHTVTYRMFTYDAAFAKFDEGIDWIVQGHPPGTVMSSMPHWVHLRTNMPAVLPPFERNARRELDSIRSAKPRYLLIDHSGGSPAAMYAQPALGQGTSDYALAYSDPSGLVSIYRLRDDATVADQLPRAPAWPNSP